MGSSHQFCTFFLDQYLFGAPVNKVHEVLLPQAMTRVPLAPKVIVGLMNLRGQIVPVLDLRQRLKLPARLFCPLSLNVVVRAGESLMSLLVDEIGDVIEVRQDAFESPPATLQGSVCELLGGVYKLRGRLLLVLDVDRVGDLENFPAESRDRGKKAIQAPDAARRVQ